MFKCSLEEFKQMTATVCKLIDENAYQDVVENAWKCLSLHYLNFEGSEADELLVLSYFKFAGRRFTEYSSAYQYNRF